LPEDCLVCQEHRLEVPLPGGHLVATRGVVAFHAPPWPPPASDVFLGYLMVTPRRHVPGFGELSDDEGAQIGQWIARLTRALTSLGAERVYVAVVGHGVPHLHVHLIPRWPGTPDDVPWLHVDDWEGARRGDFDAATEIAQQIHVFLGPETAQSVKAEGSRPAPPRTT
jgi:histidine triad (HIT) family protein